MDPIVILGTGSLLSYLWYYNTQKTRKENTALMEPNMYRKICEKINKTITSFDEIIQNYITNANDTFIMSEFGFNQLYLFLNHANDNIFKSKEHSKKKKDELSSDDSSSDSDSETKKKKKSTKDKKKKKEDSESTKKKPEDKNQLTKVNFYETYNNNLKLNKNIKNENFLLIDKKVKLKNEDNIKKIYDVSRINFNDFNKKWKKINGNKISLVEDGNTVIANKIIVNIKLKGRKKNGKILFNSKIGVGEKIVKVKLDKDISLLIYDGYIEKKTLFNRLENIENKKRQIALPQLNIETLMDYKRISDLDDITIGKKVNISNIISICNFKLNIQKKDSKKENSDSSSSESSTSESSESSSSNSDNSSTKSKSEKKYKEYKIPDTFSFALLYEPNQQIIMYGKYHE